MFSKSKLLVCICFHSYLKSFLALAECSMQLNMLSVTFSCYSNSVHSKVLHVLNMVAFDYHVLQSTVLNLLNSLSQVNLYESFA
jgi:hypothetical protein